MFTLEEIDGSDYIMEKDELGGTRVLAAGDRAPTTKGARDDDDEDDDDGGEAEEGEEEDEDGAMTMETGDDYDEEEGTEGGNAEESGEGHRKKIRKKEKKAEKRKVKRREEKRQKRDAKAAGISSKKDKEASSPAQSGDAEEGGSSPPSHTPSTETATTVDLPGWSPASLGGVDLHPLLLRNIARQGFQQPTPIQKECLPLALALGRAKVIIPCGYP